MKNYLLPCVLVLGLITPFFVSGDDGWGQGHQVSSNKWIKEAGCESVINSSSCDYTGSSVVLRYGYEYQFNDEFWAGNQDRRMKNFCYQFKEQSNFGDYNQGANPSFGWTSQLANNGYWVYKNTSLRVLSADRLYQIKAVPDRRSQNNLFIKYVIEYANDETAKTRYHHTECFPYEISRCGDGVVDTDWFKKDPTDPAEKCDPADPNKTGWGNGGCSRTCEPITVAAPVCNSTYNGQRLVSLVSGDYLCEKGTISEFGYSDSTHKWTWKCNNTAGEGVDCSATKPYCGDGIKDAGETCDPQDPNREGFGNGGCDNSCNPITVAGPACNSDYNGKRVDSLSESSKLCNEGTATGFNYDSTNHKWTWKCGNTLGTTVDCSATKPYCGDGIKDTGEQCDDGEKNGTAASSCSSTCTTVSSVSCGAKDKGRTYFFNKQTTPWLTTTSTGMCDSGLTVGTPTIVGTDSHLEWTCSNTNGSSTTCTAYQEYCGDGIVQGSEECDGGDFCTSQCKTVTPSEACDQTFTSALRLNETKTFIDTFNAGWHDRYLFDKEVIFKENHGDYNNGSDPTFSRTSQLVSNGMKVGANSSMPAIQSTPYHVLSAPSKRAWDNLYIEYTIWYDNVDHATSPSRSNLYSHKECAYYEISRCGDGVLDTNYGEICDPNDPNETGWGNGGCDDTCKPVTVDPDGELLIKKELVGSKEVKNTGDIITWKITVTASGGDVTDFIVTDHLPSILGYSGYTVTSNPSGLTVSSPTLSGDNVEWNVTGTLKKGDSLVITLTTYAKEMPTQDFTNVACVRENPNDPEKCDQVDIPVDGTYKIEKTLIGTKEIKNTGDAVVWNIKVTAIGGNVKDLIITDKMPSVLGYSGYMVIRNSGLTISEPTVSGDTIKWEATGTLKSGDYIEIQLTTYAKEMPDREYKNVACVKGTNPTDPEKCDDEDLPAPDLWIKKHFTDGSKTKTVKIGDEIAYKITFGNSGTSSATITSIKDFLPKNVQYVSSEMFVNEQSVHSNTTQDGVYIDIYGGITLSPQSEGYIILTGKVLSEHQDSRTNFACIYLNDKKIDCDDARHDLTDEVMCLPPDIEKNSFQYNGSTKVTCKTSPAGSTGDIQLDCGNGTIFTGSNISELTETCTYNAQGTYTVQCKVNGEDMNNCKGTVKATGGGGGGEDPHCKAPTIVSSGDYVKEVTCKTDNGDDYMIGITCFDGDEIHVSSGKVSSFTHTCKYDKAGNYNIQCYVPKYRSDNVVTKNDTLSRCGFKATIDPLCKKPEIKTKSFTSKGGITEVVCKVDPETEKANIELDCGSGAVLSGTTTNILTGSNISVLTGTCIYPSNNTSSTKTYTAQCKVDGKTTDSCKDNVTVSGKSGPGPGCSNCGRKEIEDIILTGSCFNVNGGNASIEYGEYLPFYLNVMKLEGHKDDEDPVYVWDPNIKQESSCDKEGQLALNSMKCHYEIKKGIDNKAITSGVVPCLAEDGGGNASKPMIQKWIERQNDTYNKGKPMQSYEPWVGTRYTFKSNVVAIRDFWENVKEYGEYKISLTQIDYLYCNEHKEWASDSWNPVCQSNVTLTKSYTVQKTPSGNLTASTEVLDTFTRVDGKGTKFSSYLGTISTSSYNPNQQVKDAMDKFIKKYEKLAVNVGNEMKKVPGKSIYFISGDKTIRKGEFNKPFTFVQTDSNKTITIQGDAQYNMMILTKGNIVFEGNCETTQKVKGIFYAEGTLQRNGVNKNNNLSNNYWCDEGGLVVKGVLIGKDFNKLMDKSRSSLNDWFNKYEDEEKRQSVMNGASVLIEYSPSIFTKSTMPPGAEDFTTALTVYKN